MNLSALLTGNVAKSTTGAPVRDVAGQSDPLAFKKHLNSGISADQADGQKMDALSAFTGALNSVAALLAENGNPVVGHPLAKDISGVTGEGEVSLLPETTPDLALVVDGETVPPAELVQTEVVDEVVSILGTLVVGAVAMDQPKGNVTDTGVSQVGIQDAVLTASRRPNLAANNAVLEDAVTGKSGAPLVLKAEKLEAAASQFVMPEIKRAAAPQGKNPSIDPAMIAGQVVAKEGVDASKISAVQQSPNVQAFVADADRPVSSLMRSDAISVSVSTGVTTVLKEIVTERQVSSTTAVTERTVVEQLSNGMLKVATKQAGKVVVKLTPEHLGQVEVTLAKKNGLTTVRVVVDRAETLDMVRADIRSLERSLVDAGVDMRSNSISLALRASAGEANSDSRDFGGHSNNSKASSAVGNNNNETTEVPRRVIEGRGSILNISV